MEKAKEIELLQSLKGDTYFAQLFGDEQIDAMCQNIRNDFPIECGLKLFQASPVARENVKLKSQVAQLQQVNETVAKTLLYKANEHLDDTLDDTLEDLAECLIGHNKCLIMKFRLVLPLNEDDRDELVKIIEQ